MPRFTPGARARNTPILNRRGNVVSNIVDFLPEFIRAFRTYAKGRPVAKFLATQLLKAITPEGIQQTRVGATGIQDNTQDYLTFKHDPAKTLMDLVEFPNRFPNDFIENNLKQVFMNLKMYNTNRGVARQSMEKLNERIRTETNPAHKQNLITLKIYLDQLLNELTFFDERVGVFP